MFEEGVLRYHQNQSEPSSGCDILRFRSLGMQMPCRWSEEEPWITHTRQLSRTMIQLWGSLCLSGKESRKSFRMWKGCSGHTRAFVYRSDTGWLNCSTSSVCWFGPVKFFFLISMKNVVVSWKGKKKFQTHAWRLSYHYNRFVS